MVTAQLLSIPTADVVDRGFEESGRTRLALGLGGDGASCLGELARRTLGVGGAGVGGAAARGRSFEKSGQARLTLGLRDAGCLENVFAWRACDLLHGGAGVGLGAAARCGVFEESGRTRLALGLGGGGADCLGELAGRTFGVGDARVWTI